MNIGLGMSFRDRHRLLEEPSGRPITTAYRKYMRRIRSEQQPQGGRHSLGGAPTVRGAVRAVRGARYPTVAAENPSILGLLAYVQCAELPCRAASPSWAAKVAKTATSQ